MRINPKLGKIGSVIAKTGKAVGNAYMFVPRKIGSKVASKTTSKLSKGLSTIALNKVEKQVIKKMPVNVGMSVADFKQAKKAAESLKAAHAGRAIRKAEKISGKIGKAAGKVTTAAVATAPITGIVIYAENRK